MTVGAVILAAGFGTRLAPLTDATPKPLLEVGGRPVLDWLVDRLAPVPGLSEVVVVVNGQHLVRWAQWHSASDAAVEVRVVGNGAAHVSAARGAVADLALGLEHAGAADQWIVLAGDNLLDDDLAAHLEAIGPGGAAVLCRDLGTDVPPGRFGEITVDATGFITRFREKPADPASPLAATCTYVLPADAAALVGGYLEAGGEADSPGGFIGWLSERRPVAARVLQERYFDIGNHDTLAAARAAYADRATDDEV